MACENVLESIRSYAVSDPDLDSFAAMATKKAMEELFGYCDVKESNGNTLDDAYTRALVDMWVNFAGATHGVPGGSAGDYAASAALKGLGNLELRIVDATAYDRLQKSIEENALRPEYMYEILERNGVAKMTSGKLGPC